MIKPTQAYAASAKDKELYHLLQTLCYLFRSAGIGKLRLYLLEIINGR